MIYELNCPYGLLEARLIKPIQHESHSGTLQQLPLKEMWSDLGEELQAQLVSSVAINRKYNKLPINLSKRD